MNEEPKQTPDDLSEGGRKSFCKECEYWLDHDFCTGGICDDCRREIYDEDPTRRDFMFECPGEGYY